MTQPQERQRVDDNATPSNVLKSWYRIDPADIIVDVLGPTEPGRADDCGIRIPVECPEASEEGSE